MTNLARILATLALLGWGLLLWAVRRPSPPLQIVERVEFIEKLVYQDKIRTVTKPDGTKIVTHTVSKEVEKQEKSENISTTPTPLTQYRLGLGIGTDLNLNRIYTIEGGYRLGGTPLWLTTTISTQKTVTVGLGIEF